MASRAREQSLRNDACNFVSRGSARIRGNLHPPGSLNSLSAGAGWGRDASEGFFSGGDIVRGGSLLARASLEGLARSLPTSDIMRL